MSSNKQKRVDVLVIGAGPSGSLSSSILHKEGLSVLVLEKQSFPRFSIGESLLPQMMVFLKNAGMDDIVNRAGYQLKDGAIFRKGIKANKFNFKEKSSVGPYSTFQVKRADFDKLLADFAEQSGVEIYYQHSVLSVLDKENFYLVVAEDQNGNQYEIQADFILDASGFGRVLPKLLDLELPSNFPVRKSLFCHIKDNITGQAYDRNKILICVHPKVTEVWYWLIPFSDGTSSVGVVGPDEYLSNMIGDSRQRLLSCLQQEPCLSQLLADSEIVNEVREISGYSANVKSLYGEKFALLGNAGEFLDPVFSSGVTIALKSAELAAGVLTRKSRGENVCWEKEYSQPLKLGVNTFRVFVEAWYDGSLQDIIFFENATEEIREKICAILAGYAWDSSNPYVELPHRRLSVLAQLCKP